MIVLYQMLRLVAAGCSGAACDWFIPVSLLLPIVILVMAAITGFAAWSHASHDLAPSLWPLALGVLTLVSVVGPILALLVFRDSPNQFVAVATVLLAATPAGALAYAIWVGRR